MKNNKELLRLISNIKGKKLLEETLMKYSMSIINEIEKNPEVLPELLEELDVDQETFIDRLQNNSGNITFYDETLSLVKKKENDFGMGNRR